MNRSAAVPVPVPVLLIFIIFKNRTGPVITGPDLNRSTVRGKRIFFICYTIYYNVGHMCDQHYIANTGMSLTLTLTLTTMTTRTHGDQQPR